MKTNDILRCFFAFLALLFLIFLGSPIGAQLNSSDSSLPETPLDHNVTFYCHGFTDSNLISGKYLPPLWFVNDFSLKIFFKMPFLRYNRFIMWNETGITTKGVTDHTMFTATNYTGLIIHRRWLLGYIWTLYGHCTNYTLRGPYGKISTDECQVSVG